MNNLTAQTPASCPLVPLSPLPATMPHDPDMAHSTEHTAASPTQRRRGMLTLELLLILPFVLVVLFAVVQFSFVLLSYQAISASANIAAREAALPSTDLTATEAAATAALNGWVFQDDIEVLVYVNPVYPAPTPATNAEVAAAVTGDVISVEVQILQGKVAPDLLKFVGLSLADKHLVTTYTSIRE